jgi:hypothetical protein
VIYLIFEGRFEKLLSSNDINKKQTIIKVPYNSTKNNNWAVHGWKPETKQEPCGNRAVPFMCINGYYVATIHLWNWKEKMENSILNIVERLQRYPRHEKSMHVNMSLFSEHSRIMDSRMRELTNEGIGVIYLIFNIYLLISSFEISLIELFHVYDCQWSATNCFLMSELLL